MPLQTRNVFIDTEFFVKAGLEFSSRTIESFKDICSDGELNHITSTIVVREVDGKISDHIREALNGVKDFRRKAKILTHSTDAAISGLFAQFDKDDVESHALQVFADFLDESNTTVLDLSKVDPDEIIRMYFEREAPFQEGKKKTEFPDAFTMLALKGHLRGQEEIYVVSEDKDLIAFCVANPRFIIIESLSKLLDLYNAHDQERSDFIKNLIEAEKNMINEEIVNQVQSADIYNSSTWEDAEVESLTVSEVSDFEPSIIHIDDESCQISFDVEVKYLVTVTGPDFNNATYDRESGSVYTFDDSTREEEGKLNLTVELELSYQVDGGVFEIQDLGVYVTGLSGGIEVSVEENGAENYY
jgi:hypothetical protein